MPSLESTRPISCGTHVPVPREHRSGQTGHSDLCLSGLASATGQEPAPAKNRQEAGWGRRAAA